MWTKPQRATEIDSLPAELDESKRRILQLEIEAQALKKEDDEQSKDRLAKIEEELAELKKSNDELVKRWEAQKAAISRVREVKKEIETRYGNRGAQLRFEQTGRT